ncbi:hypothetical protein RLOC_00012096 [Lonchura striata]|uniref:Uncharacterized protein n=1 Tax=Lonchura striata TaxID=40157 RepID=A0A218UN34_9PASE|nr:hypothetical protein RLOC_00012096 [Lonchura striata domestica]
MKILSALLILILVDQLKAQGTPVTPVLEATSVEQSSDPSTQPSTELPPDYSGDSHKENGTEQVGNNGVQEGEQTFWELSGESSAESTPKPSMEPSQEPTQESPSELSGTMANKSLIFQFYQPEQQQKNFEENEWIQWGMNPAMRFHYIVLDCKNKLDVLLELTKEELRNLQA